MKNKARIFAIAAHGGQKYGNYPYSVHLDAVAKIADEYGEKAAVIAYLHDVVEDTFVSINDIEKEFGKTKYVSLEDGLRATIEWQRALYANKV